MVMAMVLGADPDTQPVEWEEPQARPRPQFTASKEVWQLTEYFGYHKDMKMSQRFDDKDKVILNAFFSKKLKQGFAPDFLKKTIDRFYQSWAKDSTMPALTYTSTKVQDALMEEPEIHSKDPILEWMLQGMPDDGPFEDSKEMRKALLIHSHEALFRYPEAVADITKMEGGLMRTGQRLRILDSVIRFKLGLEDLDMDLVPTVILNTLPHNLRSAVPAPSHVRPRQSTVALAIGRIPTTKGTR